MREIIEPGFEPKPNTEEEKRGLDEITKRKIHKHLNYLDQKERYLLLKDPIQNSLFPGTREILPANSKEFQELKELIYGKTEKAIEQLEKDSPGKELLEKLIIPTQEEEEAKKTIDMYSQILKDEKIGKDMEKYIKKRMAVIQKRIIFWSNERKGWLNKLENLGKED